MADGAKIEAVLRFCEERAESFGALRKSALTAVALDQAVAIIKDLREDQRGR